MIHRLLAILIVVLLARMASAQVHFNPDERRIITFTDERRGADTIATYLSSPDARVAWRAAIGLANIGDSTIQPTLIERYRTETRDSVADAEAFALGMLGPNPEAFTIISQTIFRQPSEMKLVALARTAIPNQYNDIVKTAAALAEAKKLPERSHAEALLRLALRKITTLRMMDDAELLASSDDAEARWRAAYVFARVGDSMNIAHRIEKLKELSTDLGSPNVRMFAATALGRVHNPATDSALIRAYRSETDWRVRVNILHALAKSLRLDSAIFAVIRSATEQAVKDDPASINIGVAAQKALGNFVTEGKLSHADSDAVRDYVDAFNGFDGRNAEVADPVRARATLSGARLMAPSLERGVRNFILSNSLYIREIALQAMGVEALDTEIFSNVLQSVPRVSAREQVPTLICLDSMWQRGKNIPWFRNALEHDHLANIYRTTLIRITGVVLDPEVAAVSLELLCDSTIVQDTFRRAANEYVLGYLKQFGSQQFRDLLMASVCAETWLRDRSPEVAKVLLVDYNAAREWHDNALMDSIRLALIAVGAPTNKLAPPLPIQSNIDWNYIENIPAKMLIGLEHGSMQIKLHTFEAPLTVASMTRLSLDGYLSGLLFHRVVPNFVVQTGDPSGSGFGGPGYAIRTEISPITYEQDGMTGMASDGKDTEGSQWFITQCPTPHLDGRYTIWAEVVSGKEDLMKIQRGDKVTSVYPMP